MSYTAAVKAVMPSVAKKSLVQWMTHFHIVDKQIIGVNGVTAASAPIDIEGTMTVDASRFAQAVGLLGDTLNYKIGDKSVLLNVGNKRVNIDLLHTNAFEYSKPRDEWHPVPAGMMEALKICHAFIDPNANNLWSHGVWCNNGYAYSTNMNAVIKYEMGDFHNKVLLPLNCVQYLLDRDEAPTDYCLHMAEGVPTQAGFRYADGSWVNASLYAEPSEHIINLYQRLPEFDDELEEVDGDLRKAVKNAGMFSDGILRIQDGKITGGRAPVAYEEDISYHTPYETIWSLKDMVIVMGVAKEIKIPKWPDPAKWRGDKCQGLIKGREVRE